MPAHDMSVGLSKSRTLKGLQCHKLLWWIAHGPAASELEIDPQRRAVLDQGRRVGKLARTYVPGGVLIDLPYDAYEERLAATREALAQGAPALVFFFPTRAPRRPGSGGRGSCSRAGGCGLCHRSSASA